MPKVNDLTTKLKDSNKPSKGLVQGVAFRGSMRKESEAHAKGHGHFDVLMPESLDAFYSNRKAFEKFYTPAGLLHMLQTASINESFLKQNATGARTQAQHNAAVNKLRAANPDKPIMSKYGDSVDLILLGTINADGTVTWTDEDGNNRNPSTWEILESK